MWEGVGWGSSQAKDFAHKESQVRPGISVGSLPSEIRGGSTRQGAGTVPKQRDEAQPEAGHRAGSLSGGHGWECWRKGGTSEQKGKDSLFFRSFVKPTVKSEQAVPKTTLPSDTICKLGEVPQSTIMFSNSLEGIPEHTVGCYTRGYGLLQGRDAG